MSVKLLTEHKLEFLSLKGGCTGSFESTLVKMSHCWKSHVMAHMYRYLCIFQNFNIYKRIFSDLINMKDLNKPESYRTWADLRDMLVDLVS